YALAPWDLHLSLCPRVFEQPPPPVHVGQPAIYEEPEPGPRHLADVRPAAECLEDLAGFGGRHTETAVTDRDRRLRLPGREGELHGIVQGAELPGVAHELGEDLPDPPRVDVHDDRTRRHAHNETICRIAARGLA